MAFMKEGTNESGAKLQIPSKPSAYFIAAYRNIVSRVLTPCYDWLRHIRCWWLKFVSG